jgi:hypothetical protein
VESSPYGTGLEVGFSKEDGVLSQLFLVEQATEELFEQFFHELF